MPRLNDRYNIKPLLILCQAQTIFNVSADICDGSNQVLTLL